MLMHHPQPHTHGHTRAAQCNLNAVLPGVDLSGCTVLNGNLVVSVGFLPSTVASLVSVVGDVTFTGLSLVSLNAFSSLKNITGNVLFTSYLCLTTCQLSLPQLQTVSGSITFSGITGLAGATVGPFPQLQTIGGSLDFNPAASTGLAITAVSGFANVLAVAGSIRFTSNSVVSSISGFMNALQTVQSIEFSGLTSLTTLASSFAALKTASGGIRIASCNSLTAIPAFPALVSVASSLEISSLPGLAVISGLGSLRNTSSLILSALDSLAAVPSFGALERVWGLLQLKSLPQLSVTLSFPSLQEAGVIELTSLGVTNLNFPQLTRVASPSALVTSLLIAGTDSIRIATNPALQSLKGFRSLASVGSGRVLVSLNNLICNSWPVNITSALNTTAGASYAFVSFSSPLPACTCSFASTVTSLVDFTNCKTVLGNVSVDYLLSYLEGSYAPSFLQAVTGSLILQGSSSLFPLLDYFPSLAAIGGSLILRNTSTVLSTRQSALATIGGALIIESNLALSDLKFLGSLVSINGSSLYNGVDVVSVKSNPALSTLAFLSNVNSVGSGRVTVRDNQKVCSLSLPAQLPNFSSVNFDACTTLASILVLNNTALSAPSSLNFLRALKSVSADIRDDTISSGTTLTEASITLLRRLPALVGFALGLNVLPNSFYAQDLAAVVDDFVNPAVFAKLEPLFEPLQINPPSLVQDLEDVLHAIGRRDAINLGCIGYTTNLSLPYITVQSRQVALGSVGHTFTAANGDVSFSIPQSASSRLTGADPSTSCKGLQLLLMKASVFPKPTEQDGLSLVGKNVSSVLGFSVRNASLTNLDDPVVFSIRVSSNTTLGPVCAFWNYTLGLWDTRGCQLVNSTSDGVVTCSCNHLTNFAVLFGTSDSANPIGQSAAEALTYIGCGLSILGCLITIITFLIFKNLRVGPIFLVLNLCFSIMVSHILLIISGNIASYPTACKCIAILLHYFLLTGFAWMLSLGVFLYFNVVKLQQQLSHQHKWYFICSWFLPALMIACIQIINAASETDAVVYSDMETCWIVNNSGLYGAFIVPVALVVGINLVIFGIVVFQIRAIRGNQILQKGDRNDFFKQLKIYFTMLILLGITWVFAYLALIVNNGFFMVAFIVCCSLQGFSIFLAYCVNGKVTDAYKSFYSTISSRSSSRPGSSRPERTLSAKAIDVTVPMDSQPSYVIVGGVSDSRRSSTHLMASRADSDVSYKKAQRRESSSGRKGSEMVEFSNVWIGEAGSALSTHL